MLRLDLPTESRWIALPLGVRVQVRPLTTALEIAADNRAGFLLAEARHARGELTAAPDRLAAQLAGEGADDVAGLTPLASEPAAATATAEDADAVSIALDREFGLRIELKIIALAQVLVMAWEGVGDATGAALAPVTPANVSRLMLRRTRTGPPRPHG